jgi:predicted transcriptional regulator
MTTQEFKDAQKALGLTNKAMADLLGVTVSYVEMLRGGKRSCSRIVQRVINQALIIRRGK